MLVSKINPPATKIMQNNPFATTTITGEYMTVVCTKYVIGAIPDSFNDDSVFLVKFGNIKYELKPDGSQGNPMLDIIVAHRLTMKQAELSTWNSDDTILHELVIQKLNSINGSNIQIVSQETMNMQHTA